MSVPAEHITQTVKLALAEDIGDGDVTASLLDQARIAMAELTCREPAIICGTQWFDEVFHQLDSSIKINWQAADGDSVAAEQVLCTIKGPAHTILTAERTALNLLQTLSGTATVTRQYVDAMGATKTRLLDTRKTLPGLRLAQKYAVKCGGGHNHRIGLYDMILIKENHIISCGSISAAVKMAVQKTPGLPLEIEVESLPELEEALASGAKRILLDNFDTATLEEAVAITGGRAKLEASGNITLVNIARIAQTGVDYISTGAITKNIKAIDLSLRIIK